MKKKPNISFLALLIMSVFLVFANSCEEDKPAPVASFTVNKSEAVRGDIISFTNTSENAFNYAWDFRDGYTSTKENPTHSYLNPGTFFVKLTASGEGGEGITYKSITITTSTAVFNPSITYGTITDNEGNTYKTVTIGTQTWMAENLRATIYNDGSVIPIVIDNVEWSTLTSGAYCNYNNATSIDTIATYGRLYNWYAVNTGKLCPTGWHVPTDDEWTTLTDYLGSRSVAGGKLKESSTTHWHITNTGATNETGFTALPGGRRGLNGVFYYFGGYGYWWSATELDSYGVWSREMFHRSTWMFRDSYSEEMGCSVRCVKD